MNNLKPILITDLDDVICEDGYIYLLNEFLQTSYTKEDFKNCYYVDSIVEDENLRKSLIKFWATKNVYLYTNLIEGAYESLKNLSDYLDIYICTACYFPEVEAKFSSIIFKQKYDYILKNLDFINPANIIFANNKNIFSGATFQIDDRIENLDNDTQFKILFSAYHNTEIPDEVIKAKSVFRLDNWSEVESYIHNKLNFIL